MAETYKYGNGFDIDKALTALRGRLAWLSSGTSKSKRFFDDGSFHALITEKVVKDIQEDPTINTSSLTDLKTRLEGAAIRRALDSVFCESSTIDAPEPIYVMVPNHVRSAETPAKDFVGYEIVASSKDHVVQINSAILNFSADTQVTLYLFLEGEDEPIWTSEEISAVANRRVIASLNNCYLSSARTRSDIFYFGYKFSELQNGAKPYKEDGVMGCGAALWGAKAMYSDIPVLYGRAQYPSVMYGLNLEISGLVDYTQRIQFNPSVFDELIGLQMASIILQDYIFSARKNDTQRAMTPSDKASVQMDLTGTAPVSDLTYAPGNINKRILLEVEKIRSSFYKKKSGVLILP